MNDRNDFYWAELAYDREIWMPPHSHDDVATIAYCLNGVVEEFYEGKAVTLETATVSYLPMGLSHANRFRRETKTFLLLLRTEWFERFPQIKAGMDRPRHYSTGLLPVTIATRMHREFLRSDCLTPLVLEGMLLELTAEMVRGSVREKEKQAPRWLRQATDFLHAHFAEDISAEVLAASAGVHPSHLMRTFRQVHRCTVGEYVRALRIEYACRLLSTSELSLAEIALAAGFSDQSHFSHAFKRHIGMTPAVFRKSRL